MKKAFVLFILLLLGTLAFGQDLTDSFNDTDNAEETDVVFYWDVGGKLVLDTANLRLGEEPCVAYGLYGTFGGTYVFDDTWVVKTNFCLGFSTYAGFLGFASLGVNGGRLVYTDGDFLLSVLASLDFQTYCYRIPFWAMGVQVDARHFFSESVGLYADFGLYYDFSFVSFMTKFELGATFR